MRHPAMLPNSRQIWIEIPPSLVNHEYRLPCAEAAADFVFPDHPFTAGPYLLNLPADLFQSKTFIIAWVLGSGSAASLPPLGTGMRRAGRSSRRAEKIFGVADTWVDRHILVRQSSEAERGAVEDSGSDTLGYSILSGAGAQSSNEPPSRDSQTESTMAGNNVDQTSLMEGPANPTATRQVSATASDQWNESISQLSTLSGSHNTWITATLDETSSTGVTIVPFLTIRNLNTTSSEADAVLPTTTLSPADDISTTGVSPSITSQNTTSTEASIPRVVHVDRVTQAERTGTIVGVTIGAAVVVLLVVLTILAYVRGGAMRGSFSAFRSNRKGSPRSQIVTNSFHNQERSEALRDAERGAMHNNERWCRDKDKMMAMGQPPALQFNPELPLPPIVLHDASKRT